ncbi:hypothetical protein PVK06_026808 [Gossypium arboreum]|uniref:Uncharacterized protein n=1 Tax=Gossypium arboreum TaxID=29729 RepID=A0ABR0NYR4_GOSAR|nr:hypothetical protein PVK06_026808 [Gossypium arboreum]
MSNGLFDCVGHKFVLKYARNDGHVATSTSDVTTLNFEASKAENRVDIVIRGSWHRDCLVYQGVTPQVEYRDRNRSWDEGHDMSAWYNDKVYDEGFYEEWEIEEHERLLMMELQQTPSDEAVQDVPNLDYGYSCIVVNHLELDCPKPLDINNNKASSLMNGASTTKGSYVEKYNMP